ncbi:CsbD family protein [Agromyces sp. SYSU K20354]|uniref:CsbD family protein n=1 Tax=Agromyces cavernae TaxID=2898659 RepID=UPI001E5C7CEA|nr:CsbD family protein [Agromyces cavernae]MCD2443587.1 CsbD family protein [Agromyces cavernae]
MGVGDKAKHQAEEAVGKVKQGVGKATGDERLEAEGHAEETKADLKQAGDEAKDVGKKVKDAFSDN